MKTSNLELFDNKNIFISPEANQPLAENKAALISRDMLPL